MPQGKSGSYQKGSSQPGQKMTPAGSRASSAGRSSQPRSAAAAMPKQHPYQGPSGAKRNPGMNDRTMGYNTPGHIGAKGSAYSGPARDKMRETLASANVARSTAAPGHPYAGPQGMKRNAGMNDRTVGHNQAYGPSQGGGASSVGAVKSSQAD